MMTWSSSNFISPSSYSMEMITMMHDYIMIFLLSIMLLIMSSLFSLTLFSMFNYEFFENQEMESVWTLSPFLILIFILGPSLSSLYLMDSCLFCGLTVSIMGHQWYWSYFYSDSKDLLMDSYMVDSDFRLMDVDNRVLIPTMIPVRALVSSSDVIHSWSIPSFGLKMDAIPGRINQFCFSCSRSGIFFGQCSEICGVNHSFMPIVMEAVSFKDFFSKFI